MLKVKNWQKYQHYKDRSPPWIRLHKILLDDRAINALADRYFRVLIGLWLLASEDKTREGFLPDIPDIAFRLRKSEDEIHEALQHLTHFIEGYASAVLAPCLPGAVPETETETEAETDSLAGSTTKVSTGTTPDELISLAD